MRPVGHHVRGELAMRQVAGARLLDPLRHHREPNRQNFQQQRHRHQNA